PLITNDDHVSRFDFLSENRPETIRLGVEDPCRPHELRLFDTRGLRDTTLRGQITFQNGEMSTTVDWFIPSTNNLLVAVRLRRYIRQFISQSTSCNRDAVSLETVIIEQYLQNLLHPSGAMEVHRDEA